MPSKRYPRHWVCPREGCPRWVTVWCDLPETPGHLCGTQDGKPRWVELQLVEVIKENA